TDARGEPGRATVLVRGGVEGGDDLAGARRMRGEPSADMAEDAHAVGVLDALDEDDIGSVRNGEVRRERGGVGDLAQCREGGVAERGAGQREGAELVDVHAEPVEAGLAVLLDEPAADESLEESVCRRLGDTELARDVGDAEGPVHGEALEEVERATDRPQARRGRRGSGGEALGGRRDPRVGAGVDSRESALTSQRGGGVGGDRHRGLLDGMWYAL